MDADLTVIGGGIHGCTLSSHIRVNFPHLRLRILDAQGALLQLWDERTRACYTQYLRSPGSHNIDHSFLSLLKYAKTTGYSKKDFRQPYWRPSLALFRAHSQAVIKKWQLAACTHRAFVRGLKKTAKGWEIHSKQGAFPLAW